MGEGATGALVGAAMLGDCMVMESPQAIDTMSANRRILVRKADLLLGVYIFY